MAKTNNSSKRKLTKAESAFVIKKLLQRMDSNSLSYKEQKIIEGIKASKPSDKSHQSLTDKQLEAAIDKNREEIFKKISNSPSSKKTKKRNLYLPFIASGVAAVIALLIIILTPFSSHDNEKDSRQTASINKNIKRFSTDKCMRKITLPDGSTIFMNVGTTVNLDTKKFNAYTREIWLDEGEVFFDVESDANRPFIVHTPNGVSTRVLGTSFNIKAYSILNSQVVSVNTGRVQIFNKQQNIVVHPNYKVSINSADGKFLAGKTVASLASDWRTGKILLDNATTQEVAMRLKQYYDIELIFDKAIKCDDLIYTSFSTGNSLDEVLSVISKLYNTKYKKEGDKVFLIK